MKQVLAVICNARVLVKMTDQPASKSAHQKSTTNHDDEKTGHQINTPCGHLEYWRQGDSPGQWSEATPKPLPKLMVQLEVDPGS